LLTYHQEIGRILLRSHPYYFLGHVPCRSISFIAIIVRAVADECRVVYTHEPLQLSPIPQPIKSHFTVGDERTPRASRCTDALTTPCPIPHPHPHPASHPDCSSEHGDNKEAVVWCTLSLLLGIPKLASLASWVMQAKV